MEKLILGLADVISLIAEEGRKESKKGKDRGWERGRERKKRNREEKREEKKGNGRNYVSIPKKLMFKKQL